MKKFYLAFLLLVTLGAGAQKDSVIVFTGSIEYNATKKAIYNMVKEFVSDVFNSYKAVIDVDDREAGLLVVNGVIPLTLGKGPLGFEPATCNIKMKINIRDNQLTYKITDRGVYYDGGAQKLFEGITTLDYNINAVGKKDKPFRNKYYMEAKTQYFEQVEAMLHSLKSQRID